MERSGKSADWFDKEYFSLDGTKSGFSYPYTWAIEGVERLKRVQEFRGLFNPVRVLDVGCALGFMVKALTLSGIEAEGFDCSKWAIENSEPEIRDKLKVHDVKDPFPYPDNSFDLVLAMAILEHMEEPVVFDVIRELRRVSSYWVYAAIPIDLADLNRPWGDLSHCNYRSPSYWISHFYTENMLVDLRRSKQTSNGKCQDVELAFCKGELPLC